MFRILQREKGSAAKKGQATIEYVLMLASIVVVISAFFTAFHTDVVRWLFIFVGKLLTS
ncbi:class III signal peptide-containing protein [Candidatus Avelusimicrobium luingense]|uniref:class III signal peptide-containing protein n=1 Tax=Candidatus Avelusimicrobium luingense TaxID=3416211 RepID=UPI003D13175A